MLRMAVVVLVVLLAAGSRAHGQGAASAVLWHEGEDYAGGPKNAQEGTAEKAPASGGLALSGPVLSARPGYVRYDLDLPQPVPDARLLLRYSRSYWQDPSQVDLVLRHADASIETHVSLPNTGGWGTADPSEWGMAAVEPGSLASGAWQMTFSAALDEHGDVNIDGFFLVPGDVEITADELAAADRIHINGSRYVGLSLPSATIIQDRFEGITLIGRAFAPCAERVKVALLDEAATEVAVLRESQPMDLPVQRAAEIRVPAEQLRDLPDGAYTLRAEWQDGVKLDVSVQLVGDLARGFEGRLSAIKAFHKKLADSAEPDHARYLPDYEHAVEFLSSGWQQVLEGRADSPAVEGIRRTLRQYEAMGKLIATGEDPYATLRGDLRLAFRSQATGKLEPYRLVLPDSYRPDGSTPVFMALNGTEDRFLDRDDALTGPIAMERGYAIISPRASSGYFGKGQRDLVQVVGHVLGRFPGLDPKRTYCTGASAGGFGTYTLATRHPDLFAAIACASGVGNWRRYARPDRELIERFTDVPTLILHGEIDNIVLPDSARAVAAKLDELGYPYEMHIFPSHGHSYTDHARQYLTLTLDYFDRYTKAE